MRRLNQAIHGLPFDIVHGGGDPLHEALRTLVKHLASAPPRKIKESYPLPLVLFTDGAFEPGGFVRNGRGVASPPANPCGRSPSVAGEVDGAEMPAATARM